MKYYLLGVFSIISFWGLLMQGQETKVKYQPNELQSLRLKVTQQQAQIAQKDLFIAQQNFQIALAALKVEGDKVKRENQWDAGVIFNPETLMFIDPPKPIEIPQGAEK